jgi:trans-aconitate 2-methyltransferase
MPWNPAQYHKFARERFAPFDDLLALIHRRDGLRVVDLGCGTGELTRRLADALPNSEVLGIDTSEEMLERARTHERPGLRFERGSIETADGEWDLVFSNAALQWVKDHRSLLPQILSLVTPGGQLAVQVPSNHAHPSHTAIAALAGEEPFKRALHGWTRRSPVLGIEVYAELLYTFGATDIVVFEKVYPHVLENADAIVEWMRGTALVPLLERLPPELHEAFLERYRQRLRERRPSSPVFFAFRRILISATRSE